MAKFISLILDIKKIIEMTNLINEDIIKGLKWNFN